jgi:hypothetical protein
MGPEMAMVEGRRVLESLTLAEGAVAFTPTHGHDVSHSRWAIELHRACEGLDSIRRRIREQDEGVHSHFRRVTGGDPEGTPSPDRLAVDQLAIDLGRVIAQWEDMGWGGPSQVTAVQGPHLRQERQPVPAIPHNSMAPSLGAPDSQQPHPQIQRSLLAR